MEEIKRRGIDLVTEEVHYDLCVVCRVTPAGQGWRLQASPRWHLGAGRSASIWPKTTSTGSNAILHILHYDSSASASITASGRNHSNILFRLWSESIWIVLNKVLSSHM